MELGDLPYNCINVSLQVGISCSAALGLFAVVKQSGFDSGKAYNAQGAGLTAAGVPSAAKIFSGQCDCFKDNSCLDTGLVKLIVMYFSLNIMFTLFFSSYTMYWKLHDVSWLLCNKILDASFY